MNVFDLRDRLIRDYEAYVKSFIAIRDPRIRQRVEAEIVAGALWPEPRIGLNPNFEPGRSIDELVAAGVLHSECSNIFRLKEATGGPSKPLRLHRHQDDAVVAARSGKPYLLTTGTGSGKSLAYLVPIVDRVLREGSGKGLRAIVVYPMNALANSQARELSKFLQLGYPTGGSPVTFRRYTGQEKDDERDQIIHNPPDILLTNYVMLELLLTRVHEQPLIRAARGLQVLVLDELHTYRGRQGADVALLIRRVREACESPDMQCVGTSATLAAGGTWEERRRLVADVATTLFGSQVDSSQIIGETLRRVTPIVDFADQEHARRLRKRLQEAQTGGIIPGFQDFVDDPLTAWIESTLGLDTEPETKRLVRTTPRPVRGAEGVAKDLSAITAVDEDRCAAEIQKHLLLGYSVLHSETGFPTFAFRLHQFIRRGDTVYTTLEPEATRHLTLDGQRFAPGGRDRFLYPLVFCRECGQEYASVHAHSEGGARTFVSPLGDEIHDDGEENSTENGYLYVSQTDPWPDDGDPELHERVPDDWLEEVAAGTRIRRDRRKYIPERVSIDRLGRELSEQDGDGQLVAHFVRSPFRFCLACGVSHAARQGDYTKLATLGAGGRSSATTVLSLAAIQGLRETDGIEPSARKLLTFTDNRQDASLQAGHFNDFVQVGMIRSALYRAVKRAGAAGLVHAHLAQAVFDTLALEFADYAADPTWRYAAKEEADRALREVLTYRVYLDNRRGWRLTSPNLEQCGLLVIDYLSLDDLCSNQSDWQETHVALRDATPQARIAACKTLLDFMRRSLAIRVDHLETRYQETLQQVSSQRLRPPWGLDENESRLERASVLVPRSRRANDYGGFTYLSPRSGFGQYLRRRSTLAHTAKLRLTDTEEIIEQLLSRLRLAGLVEVVRPPAKPSDVPGYQLPAAALIWKAGDGKRAFHDPIRIPREPKDGIRPNRFFRDYYETVADFGRKLEAREHTAQVPGDVREQREEAFRKGELPILYCSPTMELGVDIAGLNVVGMRNVPPTPANYAQRSGRAGRSGQPALVFTYCTSGSPHDQYFFRRPEQMVSGLVAPPRIDLANEDLVRAHVHAIWLAESGISLGNSLRDVLDTTTQPPTLEVVESVREALRDSSARSRAKQSAQRVLAAIGPALALAPWWRETWLDSVIDGLEQSFESACERWRSLYRAARAQRDAQDRIITDHSRSAAEHDSARRLRAEAESQLSLLTAETTLKSQSDFWSYRYFASEGFLPGYAFPRLPLSAFIPGRRARGGEDDYVTRPRFLAISEFGPRNVIYHEGSRFQITRVMLPVSEGDPDAPRTTITQTAKRCPSCAYLHRIVDGAGPDRCVRCDALLSGPIRELFRLQNVSTRRRDRINSDEEERQRQGYDVRSTYEFPRIDGQLAVVTGRAMDGDDQIARLAYSHAATIWRINFGWRKRQPGDDGFLINTETGEWARRPDEDEDDTAIAPGAARIRRVIPFVEDRRNCLIFEPGNLLDLPTMASLQWALASAIQAEYQLEDGELAAEPLPDVDERIGMLLYEAAEGGAGVLRRLVEDPDAISAVARRALEICHFDPDTGQDRHRSPHAKEDCEAACYDCLLSYRNQADHPRLDRTRLPELLLRLKRARVETSPTERSREEHLHELSRLAGSELEREWLGLVEQHGLRLPDTAQPLMKEAGTRPDFLYMHRAAVYVDGPHHLYKDRAERDRRQTQELEDMGYVVIRFTDRSTWEAALIAYPWIFGQDSR